MTKKELIPNAVQFFKKNPECHEMLATTDGNFFDVGKRAHFAASHATTLPDGEVYHITRDEAMGKESKPKEEPEKETIEETIEETVEETTETVEEPTEETAEDGLSPEDITEEDAIAYKEETGKAAVWRKKVTSGFVAWKESN